MATEMVTALLLFLASFLLFMSRFINISNRHKGKLKPPQPPWWPIIGNLHQLNSKQLLHRFLSSLAERYGPVMLLQLGSRPVLLVSSSQLAKECFTTNDKIFATRPRLAAGDHLAYDYKMLGWAPYGAYWRHVRKLCMLQLLSVHRIESLRHVRVEEVSALIRSLFRTCQQEVKMVNVKLRLAELTLAIIVRMVGSDRVLRPSSAGETQEGKCFREMVDETFLLAGTFNVGDYLPFLRRFDLNGVEGAMKELLEKCDVFMQALVDKHRERPRIGDSQQAEDLIDVLISATDTNQIPCDDKDAVVKANALNMINAGADTSAVTIEWALAALLQHRHALRKAQEELDVHIGRDRLVEESDLHKLKYLQAVVKETLRLYPAAPLLSPHESTEECSVGGFHVPAGTQLMVNAWAIQRDPKAWERPTEFDPERFLKGNKEIDVKGQDFELIPFSSGRRMCPGVSLALCVVSYTVARLLQSFEWNVPEGATIDMSEGPGLTMPKAVPLEAVIRPRLPLNLY